jgi:hypothetical protein
MELGNGKYIRETSGDIKAGGKHNISLDRISSPLHKLEQGRVSDHTGRVPHISTRLCQTSNTAHDRTLFDRRYLANARKTLFENGSDELIGLRKGERRLTLPFAHSYTTCIRAGFTFSFT